MFYRECKESQRWTVQLWQSKHMCHFSKDDISLQKKNWWLKFTLHILNTNEWKYVLFKVKYTLLGFTLDEYLSFKSDGVSEASSSSEWSDKKRVCWERIRSCER